MIKRLQVALPILLVAFLYQACEQPNPNYQEEAAAPVTIHTAMQGLTDVIVHDIFSPPQASRIYAYPSIAAYEVMQQQDSSLTALSGQLNGLTSSPKPQQGVDYCYPVAAIAAFDEVAKALIFSEEKIAKVDSTLQQTFRDIGIPSKVYDRSIDYGHEVAQHILAWAMEFTPPLPTDYSMDQNSQFYKELMEVYNVREALSEEETEIASFWDCNPYVLNVTGHVMHASKKITPGGHWMGIAAIAAKKSNSSFAEATKAYALTSIALADGFISCWDEKYRSNLIRPETVINEHIDPDWLPLLQTPPFPEYTSGHSVISSAAAVALTSIYGENFSFDDDVEVPYGIPIRSFPSFIAASEEAAVSRLYGGIHYRPAIDNGVVQGRALGHYIVNNLTL